MSYTPHPIYNKYRDKYGKKYGNVTPMTYPYGGDGDTAAVLKIAREEDVKHEVNILDKIRLNTTLSYIVPNVYATLDNNLGFIMEDVGYTLYDKRTNLGDVAERIHEFKNLSQQLITKMAEIHGFGISHNDLKSDQIVRRLKMVDSNHVYTIIDFDFATMDGIIAPKNGGFPRYPRVPPERSEDEDTTLYDDKTDVYMLGLLFMNYLLYGRDTYVEYEPKEPTARIGRFMSDGVLESLLGFEPNETLSNVPDDTSIYDGFLDMYRLTATYIDGDETVRNDFDTIADYIDDNPDLDDFLKAMLMAKPERRSSMKDLVGHPYFS